MAAFEYLSVLISIILALGMTRVLGGVGEMLQARSHRRIYWVHAVWIINLFLYLVFAWWIFYRWRNQQPWTFFLFVFVLVSTTILFLASRLLFPSEDERDKPVDYKKHYHANVFRVLRFVYAGGCRRFSAQRSSTLARTRTAILCQPNALFRWPGDRSDYSQRTLSRILCAVLLCPNVRNQRHGHPHIDAICVKKFSVGRWSFPV